MYASESPRRLIRVVKLAALEVCLSFGSGSEIAEDIAADSMSVIANIGMFGPLPLRDSLININHPLARSSIPPS